MTTEARPSRFGSDHIPPSGHGLDTLGQAFRLPTIIRLTQYAEQKGLDTADVIPAIFNLYPETSIRQLAFELGAAICTVEALFDFFGHPRLSLKEMMDLNKSAKKGIFGITAEARSAIGRRSAQKTMDERLGIHSPTRTKEDRQAAGSIGGRRTHALGAGAHARTHQQHLADGLRASEVLSSRKIIVDGDYFDSYLEAATAMSLEQFVPGYRVSRGVNYQVILESAGVKVDFLVDGVFIEYNPVVLKYLPRVTGFDTQEEYESYIRNLSRLDKDTQAGYSKQVCQEIAQRYFQRRREAIDGDPAYQERELVVATTPEELYDKVITRFAENRPSLDEFSTFFNLTTRNIRNEDRRRQKRDS